MFIRTLLFPSPMVDPRPVKMCVCHGVTFKEVVAAQLKDLDQIKNEFGCGTSCGTCLPYLKRMLETGETEFEVMSV